MKVRPTLGYLEPLGYKGSPHFVKQPSGPAHEDARKDQNGDGSHDQEPGLLRSFNQYHLLVRIHIMVINNEPHVYILVI